jgi:hypothetical protein
VPLPTRLVIALRSDLPAARAVNAASVLALSLGGRLPDPPAADAKDASGHIHAGLNPHPIPILSASAEQLSDLHRKARAREDLITVGFNEVARQARDYDEYLAQLANTTLEDIAFVGVAVFGLKNRVAALTKRLPLYAADNT